MADLSKNSPFLSNIQKPIDYIDERSIRPIPETTNHEYGWICSKPEFAYNFGPDIDKQLPLPDIYLITKK